MFHVYIYQNASVIFKFTRLDGTVSKSQSRETGTAGLSLGLEVSKIWVSKSQSRETGETGLSLGLEVSKTSVSKSQSHETPRTLRDWMP